MNKKYIVIIAVLFVVISLIIIYKPENSLNDTEELKAELLNINGKEQADISDELFNTIRNYLADSGVKGDIEKNLRIKDLTTDDFFRNSGCKIYEAKIDYAWVHQIIIIKEDKVLANLKGMPIEDVFLIDADKDRNYEIYANASIGSGLLSNEIVGYNPVKNEMYKLSDRGIKDYSIAIIENEAMIEVKDNKENGKLLERGKLTLTIVNDKSEITIKPLIKSDE
ncbi:MAG: hypothetical protein N4A40_05735 [Tissierellales bacterium]|nr:hypothetical protein [Tissierellales bacterium]